MRRAAFSLVLAIRAAAYLEGLRVPYAFVTNDGAESRLLRAALLSCAHQILLRDRPLRLVRHLQALVSRSHRLGSEVVARVILSGALRAVLLVEYSELTEVLKGHVPCRV